MPTGVYVRTAEAKARISAGMMGHACSDATKAAIGKGNTGKVRTPEAKARVSVANKGRVMPQSVRLRLGVANIGSHRSEETRARMSLAQMGKAPSAFCIEAARKRNTGSHASLETRAKLSAMRSGSQSCRWKGGITPENMAIRNRWEYAEWRTEVYKRDGFACQVCGDDAGGNLEAHHINNFADHKEERFDVGNGTTMCQPCHRKFHLLFGRDRNTLQELQTFLMIQEG